MANTRLLRSNVGRLLPATGAHNEAGGPAYHLGARHALAQYAATGCLNGTFYASAAVQLDTVLRLAREVEPDFVAKTALFTREKGAMKDMPALLCAFLATPESDLLEPVFRRVIDNGRMLRTFVQVIRSGVLGRKSLGSRPRRLVRQWLEERDDRSVFAASVGHDPSLADIVAMVHPRPATPTRAALYAHLLDRPHDAAALPEIVQELEAFKAGKRETVPDVPFQMLTALPLSTAHWRQIARNAAWHMTRMNLDTFARHGVFEGPEGETLTRLLADRLRDAEAMARARVFPYQVLVAHQTAVEAVPEPIREALRDALEIALRLVPEIPGKVYLCPDVSGSMLSPVTGRRRGATSVVRCVDVAALVAAAFMKKNPDATILPFAHGVVPLRLDPRDSVATNAAKLASIGGGGTSCSAPLAALNQERARGDLVVYVSDNESWIDAGRGRGTATMAEWQRFKARNPQARLVCIDIQPYQTTQAQERKDILNIGGFSDAVFDSVSAFARGELRPGHWVDVIEQEDLKLEDKRPGDKR